MYSRRDKSSSDLITLAGKSAGVAFPEHRQHYGITITLHDASEKFLCKWNPLENTEDTYFLARLHGFKISSGVDSCTEYVQVSSRGNTYKRYLSCDENIEHVTRFIITKMAADIGERMI